MRRTPGGGRRADAFGEGLYVMGQNACCYSDLEGRACPRWGKFVLGSVGAQGAVAEEGAVAVGVERDDA